jgi:hypothetical protein
MKKETYKQKAESLVDLFWHPQDCRTEQAERNALTVCNIVMELDSISKEEYIYWSNVKHQVSKL